MGALLKLNGTHRKNIEVKKIILYYTSGCRCHSGAALKDVVAYIKVSSVVLHVNNVGIGDKVTGYRN